MPRRRARTLATLVCLAGAVPAFAGTSTASAATCSFSATKPGGGYFLSLKTTNVSCTTGKKVAKAHNSCRMAKGKKAYCASSSRYAALKGYKCTEKRGNAIPTEYSSIVTCKKGSKKVVYGYQQDTA